MTQVPATQPSALVQVTSMIGRKAPPRAAAPVTIDFRRDGKTIHGAIDYHDGARYPSLRRITGVPDRLSPLLAPRT
jgi:hypothetical protein